jgi:transcriptional regulator of acetoin/glycerol metabolism
LLAETFFRRVRRKSGKDIHGISEEAMKKLVDYHWPGNVRELKSAFEYAFVSCQDSIIHPHHLPPKILWGQKTQEGATPIPVNRDEVKKRQLLDALEKTGGNQSEAARILNVSRVTVWNRMKKFNINLRRKIGA